jgi:formylglycine-generating enzyme required for sulfatase activity
MASSAAVVSDAPGLTNLLTQALQRSEVRRLVLLLDELGALPPATRVAIGFMLRSWFHDRLTLPILAKLQIIFSGGIELYDLVVTEASTLHNVCEEIYLGDLSADEAVELVADGLQALGVAADRALDLGKQVYNQAQGHPYLTQRIGALLATYVHRGEGIDATQIERAVRHIGQQGDPLLRQLLNDLREQKLEDAARRLLSAPPRFSRLNDDMVRLELIGLAKPGEGETHWQPRNPLLADVLRKELGIPTRQTLPPIGSIWRSSLAKLQRVVTSITSMRMRSNSWIWRFSMIMIPIVLLLIAIASPQAQSALRGFFQQPQDEAIRTPTTTPTKAPTVAPMPEPTLVPAPTSVPTREAIRTPATTPTKALTVTPTPEPTPLPPWVPALVAVPAGPFLMGSSSADPLAGSDEQPQHTLTLPDYWIGQTEVTNDQFRPFVEGDGYTNRDYWTEAGWAWKEEARRTQPYFWGDARRSGDNQPVVGVSWFEAVAYVRWLSAQTGHPFRLPTEAEWEKAARGSDGWIWPWGSTWAAGRANTREAGRNQTTAVGQYPEGVSPYGALDMAGNVFEWCATVWQKPYPYTVEEEWTAAYLERDGLRVLRGGSWNSDQRYARGAARDNVLARNNLVGLRVASSSPYP